MGSGLIESLARPGGNTTGMTQFSNDLAAKRVEILRELVPTIRRVAVLAYWPHPPTVQLFREVEDAARTLGLEFQLLKAGSFDAIENAFETLTRDRAEGVIVQSNAVWNCQLRQIADLANKRRLSAIHDFADFPRAGGLISYGPDRYDLARRAATYVDKIFKGAKPSELPVEQPVKFELVDQSQDCQGSRPHGAAHAARSRRRGDRMGCCLLRCIWQRLAQSGLEVLRRMPASLIGRVGSSAFRRSTRAVSMSLTWLALLRNRHHSRSIRGSKDEVEQSIGRPCRQQNGMSKRAWNSPHHRPARDIIPPLGGARVSSYWI